MEKSWSQGINLLYVWNQDLIIPLVSRSQTSRNEPLSNSHSTDLSIFLGDRWLTVRKVIQWSIPNSYNNNPDPYQSQLNLESYMSAHKITDYKWQKS